MKRLLTSILAGGMLALAASAPAQQFEYAVLPAPAKQQLADHRRMTQALASLRPQRRGVVDAYVIVIALNSDPVFNREAREAGRVLARRFDAAGRTLVLATDEGADKGQARGSPQHLALALARAAELMDSEEDVLVLYSTSHGSPNVGLDYEDAEQGRGVISPSRLYELLNPLGFQNRLLILQACFSGQFVPYLASPGTVVVTAASADRASFGCTPGNDWTFFGHAFVNHALREPGSLPQQFNRAAAMIAQWEVRTGMQGSNPQISAGNDTARWLAALDARAPKTRSAPVGNPPSELAR